MNYKKTLSDSLMIHQVLRLHPKAHIAGGLLRDGMYNKPIKDVDVFVPATRSILISLKRFGFEQIVTTTDYTDHQNEIACVYRREDYLLPGTSHRRDIDVILYNKPLSIAQSINRFPASISQIAWDGQHYHTTSAFNDTWETKVIHTRDPSPEYLNKLDKKYPYPVFIYKHDLGATGNVLKQERPHLWDL